MKTRIFFTSGCLMIIGLFPANKSLNINAQDDIYYTPSKNSVSNNAVNQDMEKKETQGMTDYEKYRAMQDGNIKKDDVNSKPDSALSPEELAKKKGMEQYGQGNTGGDNLDNQSYSQQTVDSSAQGTTVINNYYDNDPDRFGWYHNFYCDYYGDPFFYSFYDPFYWGWGLSWGFNFGWYGYDPYFYGSGYWGSPYGYWDGYYGGYAYDHGREYSPGGARRSMGGYRAPSDIRRTSLYRGQNLSSNSGRRSSSTRLYSDENGGTYKSARREVNPLYQKSSLNMTSNNNVTPMRRETSNAAYSRYKNVQTTRPGTSNYRRYSGVNNSKAYSPSYNTQKSSTRSQYNDYSYNSSNRRNTSYSNRSTSNNNTTYSNPTPRRSNESSSYTPSHRSSSSGSTYTPSRSSSGSSYSGSSGSNRSSGSGGSSSSGHSGGGGHRR